MRGWKRPRTTAGVMPRIEGEIRAEYEEKRWNCRARCPSSDQREFNSRQNRANKIGDDQRLSKRKKNATPIGMTGVAPCGRKKNVEQLMPLRFDY
jgi:hypothetical protein